MEKALVVDDSRLIRKSIRTELEKFSYKVDEAADLAEARKKLAENDYDVVTLDMVLPDGKGLDLCREMKYEQRFEQTTVIIITSLIDDSVRIQCFQNGAFGYFLKNSVREGLGVFLQNVKDFVGTCCFGGMKALLVEDSKLQRNFISGLLKKSGVSPICMENIDSAMDLLKSGSYVPDIVLIDYFFGSGKTSGEFVNFLKKDYNFKNIPIIAMTVSDDREVRNSLFYTGVNDFFHKPFDVEEFYLRLRAHLLNKILLDDMEKTNKLLQLQAITDGLTGIYNRRYFYETLSKEDSRFRRTKEPYSVILFDIDHFKRINDRFGHILGDEVIREIASIARSLTRDSDSVARYGGEEFIILLPETDCGGAYTLAEKLRKTIESTVFKGISARITGSFGVACISETRCSEKLVNLADERLYQAKNMGRNLVVSNETVVK
ncbi:GGDEF domain-containing response regulator [Geovibrio ferrireducens]|uniref:GGDEF domain-containing response regulator n=1 Tax=Geovibrio ferrireducens TaxID=46201 RepID=UPI002245541A|nr:diguanylate cyclase [Geovibrio ferrireducens]